MATGQPNPMIGAVVHFAAAHFPAFVSWVAEELDLSDASPEELSHITRRMLIEAHEEVNPGCADLEITDIPEGLVT